MNHEVVRLSVQEVICLSCVPVIEATLKKKHGVHDVVINSALMQVDIHVDPEQCTAQQIIETLQDLGYHARPINTSSSHVQHDHHDLRTHAGEHVHSEYADVRGVMVSMSSACVLMVVSMIPGLPAWLSHPWLMMALATPVQLWIAIPYYRRAWQALKLMTTTMDTLIVLGTSIAYFYSVGVVFAHTWMEAQKLPVHYYFEVSTVIIAFIVLGNFLEGRARKTMSRAIEKLINLQPAVATVLDNISGTTHRVVPVEQVKQGDILLIKPGDKIPVDGAINSGSSLVNESMITGESKPIKKHINSSVMGGTVNLDGSFTMIATNVGDDAVLAHIVALVRQAQMSQVPVQKIADRIAAWFVPCVIALALGTGLVWFMWGPAPQSMYALVHIVSVLIIACPCAIGLAGPIATIAAIDRAAQEGILIKDAQALQAASNAEVIVFDKTGTLTQGEQTVQAWAWTKDLDAVRVPAMRGIDKERILIHMFVLVEQRSGHPSAQALIAYAHECYGQSSEQQHAFEQMQLEEFQALSGLGVKARIGNSSIIIGSEQLMEQESILIPPGLAEVGHVRGASRSYAAVDKQCVAAYAVSDPLRPQAVEVVKSLQAHGLNVVLLTGDNQESAHDIAQQVGITDVYARVASAEKATYIQALQAQGKKAIMVGDGINDAPALAVADASIALGSGTEIALETASMTLLRSDITLVLPALKLSKITMRIIWQNFVWAFAYNVVLIPVAMGALYPHFGIMLNPMIAGAAMAFSSFSVVLNALRLKRITLKERVI